MAVLLGQIARGVERLTEERAKPVHPPITSDIYADRIRLVTPLTIKEPVFAKRVLPD
jgi:hypothetical protein